MNYKEKKRKVTSSWYKIAGIRMPKDDAEDEDNNSDGKDPSFCQSGAYFIAPCCFTLTHIYE